METTAQIETKPGSRSEPPGVHKVENQNGRSRPIVIGKGSLITIGLAITLGSCIWLLATDRATYIAKVDANTSEITGIKAKLDNIGQKLELITDGVRRLELSQGTLPSGNGRKP